MTKGISLRRSSAFTSAKVTGLGKVSRARIWLVVRWKIEGILFEGILFEGILLGPPPNILSAVVLTEELVLTEEVLFLFTKEVGKGRFFFFPTGTPPALFFFPCKGGAAFPPTAGAVFSIFLRWSLRCFEDDIIDIFFSPPL